MNDHDMKRSQARSREVQAPAMAPAGRCTAQLVHLANSLDRSPRVRQLQATRAAVQRKAAGGGLPMGLRTGIEALSGVAMAGVRVHYNSARPAQLNALAHAQGSDIHLAPGQDRHLPHEAWHVVQQAQGRVRPTAQLAGVAINDDAGLEREADTMGARAAQFRAVPASPGPAQRVTASAAPLQAVWEELEGGTLKWDKPINGIQWFYRPEDDKYSYQVVSTFVDKKYIPGQGQWRPYATWQEAGVAHTAAIADRVATYEKARGGGDHSIGTRPRGAPAIGSEIYVHDELPEQFDFEHEGKPTQSHFYNDYFADGGGTAVFRENYLSNPDKSFFASDAFFSQFAAAASLHKTGRRSSGGLETLPTKPPATIVRDTIDNAATKKVLQEVTGIAAAADVGESEHEFDVGQPAFAQILGTPNGKATLNIIDDFNFINRSKGKAAYTIDRITVLHAAGSGNSGWKIRLHTAKA